MKVNATSTVVWAAGINDRPAGLAEKIQPLAEAGANFEFLLARRAPEKPGKGVVFVAPLNGVKQCRAAVNNGFVRTNSLHAVRIEGPDKPGMVAKVSRALADANINLRGFSASVLGRKFVAYVALDDEDDVKKVLQLLKKLK